MIEKPTSYFNVPTIPGMLTTDGPTSIPFTTMVKSSGIGAPTFGRVSIVPTGNTVRSSMRPLSTGSGEFLLWEFPLAYWMEKEGYDVSYISNLDTHLDPASLRRGKTFLSVGHDEYWSLTMFDNVKKLIADGVNVAFFSGNTSCGVIDIMPDTAGRPHRVISRIGQFGPIQQKSVENGFPELLRLKHNGPNEATLIGAQVPIPSREEPIGSARTINIGCLPIPE